MLQHIILQVELLKGGKVDQLVHHNSIIRDVQVRQVLEEEEVLFADVNDAFSRKL